MKGTEKKPQPQPKKTQPKLTDEELMRLRMSDDVVYEVIKEGIVRRDN